MAWIPIDHLTPDKPEVLRLARIANLDTDAAFGKLVRMWIWFDANSVDGRVDGAAPRDIDAICRHDGFTQACAQIGWLVVDTENTAVSMNGFYRHMSQTAKARALKSKRQSRYRRSGDDKVDAHVDAHVDDGVDAIASTAVSVSVNTLNTDNQPMESKGKREVKRFVAPTVDEVIAYCSEKSIRIDPVRFVDFHTMKGWVSGNRQMRDWKAAVRYWASNEKNHVASAPRRSRVATQQDMEDLRAGRLVLE